VSFKDELKNEIQKSNDIKSKRDKYLDPAFIDDMVEKACKENFEHRFTMKTMVLNDIKSKHLAEKAKNGVIEDDIYLGVSPRSGLGRGMDLSQFLGEAAKDRFLGLNKIQNQYGSFDMVDFSDSGIDYRWSFISDSLFSCKTQKNLLNPIGKMMVYWTPFGQKRIDDIKKDADKNGVNVSFYAIVCGTMSGHTQAFEKRIDVFNKFVGISPIDVNNVSRVTLYLHYSIKV